MHRWVVGWMTENMDKWKDKSRIQVYDINIPGLPMNKNILFMLGTFQKHQFLIFCY